ncbi:hypothetical protein HDU98_000242 [Podochytrium sp. JEL0797]|nr:hypothetical protein HDU98_000242 [Podochytrium sp. JEL0797]
MNPTETAPATRTTSTKNITAPAAASPGAENGDKAKSRLPVKAKAAAAAAAEASSAAPAVITKRRVSVAAPFAAKAASSSSSLASSSSAAAAPSKPVVSEKHAFLKKRQSSATLSTAAPPKPTVKKFASSVDLKKTTPTVTPAVARPKSKPAVSAPPPKPSVAVKKQPTPQPHPPRPAHVSPQLTLKSENEKLKKENLALKKKLEDMSAQMAALQLSHETATTAIPTPPEPTVAYTSVPSKTPSEVAPLLEEEQMDLLPEDAQEIHEEVEMGGEDHAVAGVDAVAEEVEKAIAEDDVMGESVVSGESDEKKEIVECVVVESVEHEDELAVAVAETGNAAAETVDAASNAEVDAPAPVAADDAAPVVVAVAVVDADLASHEQAEECTYDADFEVDDEVAIAMRVEEKVESQDSEPVEPLDKKVEFAVEDVEEEVAPAKVEEEEEGQNKGPESVVDEEQGEQVEELQRVDVPAGDDVVVADEPEVVIVPVAPATDKKRGASKKGKTPRKAKKDFSIQETEEDEAMNQKAAEAAEEAEEVAAAAAEGRSLRSRVVKI